MNILNELKKLVDKFDTCFFFEFTNMDVPTMTSIRARTKEKGGVVKVVKNSILERIFPDLEFGGPTAIALSDDPVFLAKILKEELPDTKKVKFGLMKGEVISCERIIQLSEIPPYDELTAKLVGQFKAILSRLVYALRYPIAGLCSVLRNIKKES